MQKLKRLLEIEILKNLTYRPVIVFTCIYFSLLLLIGLVCTQTIPFFGISVDLKDSGLLSFPIIWNFIFYVGALFKIFLAVVIMITISNELTDKLLKQNIIDGLSRDEYLMSKLLSIIFFSLTSTFLLLVIGFVLGFTNSGVIDSSMIFHEIYFAFGYFMKLFNFLLLFLLLAVFFRRGLVILIVFFVLWVIENIIALMEYKSIYSHGITTVDLLSDYLPLRNMSNLINSPVERIEISQNITGIAFNFEIPYDHIFVSLLYILLFIFAIRKKLKTKDL